MVSAARLVYKNFSLMDNSGKKYRTSLTIPEDSFEMMQASVSGDPERYRSSVEVLAGRGPIFDYWAAVFRIQQDSHNFTLLIENPDPREGQPRLAAVSLGL